ncbi:uncharacterized protein LOC142358139 [Convolutriloba macropyga]|uniref:uncharacterized protein LOC142358139 n=1 Tax=Convolutriloba macropyga TaxID=536237 RepID=UPI003F51AEB7
MATWEGEGFLPLILSGSRVPKTVQTRLRLDWQGLPTGETDPADARTWFQLDGTIMKLNNGQTESTKDDQLTNQSYAGPGSTNHFFLMIYGGFYRLDEGGGLYALPGGYITNVESHQSILNDIQFKMDLAELSRRRCLNQLVDLVRYLDTFDDDHEIGDENNPLTPEAGKYRSSNRLSVFINK